MYQLIFSNQTNLLPRINQEKLAGIYPIRLNDSNQIVICIRQGQTLFGYKYIEDNATWHNHCHEKIFNVQSNYPLERYPWLVANRLLPDSGVIILKHPDSVRFYQPNMTKPGLDLLKEDTHFHDVYGYTLLWGSFYPDIGEIGVMTLNTHREVKFYVIAHDSLWSNTTYPLFPLGSQLSFSSAWHSANTDFFLTNLRQNSPTAIGLRTPSGLEFYQFNSNYLLDQIANTSRIIKPEQGNAVHDRLFFANLTNQVYQDILQLNNSGLFVYQYNNNQQDYLLIHHHSEFTQLHSWLPRYTDSIQLVDLNSDGHEDLLFTGPRGLTALTFDSTATTWRSLLNPDQLSGAQRYATVVGTLPAMPPTILQPSIFTQDAQGKVQWATVTQSSLQKPEEQQIPATIIVKSELSSSPQLPPRSNSEVIPKQITRTTLSQKPTLRWTEQWGNEFLKEPIDMASGQVQFSVPLVDTSAGLQLALFYHSQETSTELLGMGWSIPLAQDYIIVDYKGSIYPEEADYYLITQGRPQRLKHIASEGEIRRFQLAEQSAKQPQVTIEYHQSAQRWNIEYPTEQAIYGKANHTTAADALQWSLTWPNWRGPGHASDKTQLQPLITAWYLNARLAKHHQQALYYYYEIDNATIGDSKTYTAALRLKNISDNQQMRLLFNYDSKTQAEYTAPNPIDKDGNIVFPVELAQKHYLQGYSITTASYHQVLQFVYQINDKQRLLTAIQQQLSGYQEPVLQFSYQRSLDKQVLKSCTLPRGATVNFSYETIVPPASTVANVFSYPVTETAKITYGPDYAVMAYRNLNKIILRIMNREMTRTIINCSGETSLSCPTAQSEIKNYMLRAYHNLFIVSVESDQRKLYIFDRYSQTWSAKPVFSFTKEALINFDETTIAVAEPNSNNLRLFKRLDNQADWNETTLRVPRAITRLTLRPGLVVGYDDKRLWRFYLDSRQQWQSSVLADNLDNNTRQILARFNLTSDTQIYKEFNQNDLQIFNNFILLSSLKENHGQLSSSINLFLLDTQYNIVQRQSFEIQRENILSLTYDIKEKNSTFQLGYVQEGGYFKIRIKALFGDVIKDIRQDAMTEWIRQHNQKSEEFLKKGNLINWNLYFTGINQQGVYCSNDILLRMTGTKCQRQLSPKMFPLGKHFVLEELTVDNKLLFKLYKQDSNQNKQGQPLRELQGQVINHYPAYIAYQPTPDSVKVLTFKDEQTLDQDLTFNNEQLVESDWQNLVTIANASTTTMHAGSQECLVRPLSTLIRKPQLFVNQMNLTAGGAQRLTGYQHSFHNDLQYSKITSLKIPGANKSLFGWYEETTSYHINSGNLTKTQRWFDAARQQVLLVEKQPSNDSTTITSSSSETNSSLLWDRRNQLLISDFSPYRLADDMAAYYGFESYENNQIGNSSIAKKTWNLVGAQIIKKGFAFTGENYLQLNSTATTSPAYLEGIFQPRDQDTTYLASCWLRGSIPLTLNTPVSYLKAILSTTTGQEISGLLAQVKKQLGDWFYLELPIDFQVIKQIYQGYVTYSANNNTAVVLPSLQDVRFKITLRVEADPHQRVDLDHIRFSPLNHNFQATIYQPLTEQLTAVIKANGLVERTIYNRLDQEIASLQEDGQLKQFSSGTKTGLLVPTPQGEEVLANQPPAQLNFQPESGFYETFDAYALRSRWKLDNPAAWSIAPGQLWHEAPEKHRIKADGRLFDGASAAFRCYFALQKRRASLSFNWKGVGSFQFTRKSDNFTTLTLPNKHSIKPLPLAGELIIMLEKNQAWLWLDGVLLLDQLLQISGTAANLLTPWSSFFLEARGQVLIEDCLVMNNPALQIEYYNAFGEKTQVIQLEDANTVDVTETLYDQLGRPAITTKTTRIHRELGQPLLVYRPNFVSNINPVSQQSVWHTGRLEGEVDRLNPNDQGVAYARTQYAPNPFNEESVLGLAGLDFSVTGPYATHLSRHANIAFLSNLFPTNQGYRQKVESLPNGSQYVAIFDKHNNQVARYTRVPSYNSLLSTYEYDSEKRLIKILPPLYHEKVDTASKLTPWQPGEAHLSPQEKQWQQALGTFLSYDLNGNLIRKITPDSGRVEYLYNSANQMRFMISLGAANQTQHIVYFDYDMHGQLSRTGHLKQLLSIDALQQYLESQSLPHTQDYQLFDYADDHLDPVLRGRIKNCTTYNPDQPVAEEIRFNSQEQVIAKSTLAMSEQTETDKFPDFTKQYVGDKVRTLEYPITVNGQLLRLVYHYNRLGQLVKLGIAGNQNHYISFSYHGSGQLASEQDHLNTSYNFTRSYRYNSPGFLEQLSDPFLTEDITYTKKGYGQAGFGDGMVMQTVFNAIWPANADGRWFQLQEDMLASNHSATCIQALKRTGYLTINGQPKKLYIRKIETALPLVCGGKTAQKITKLIAEKQPPGYYGHRYAYGNHQELVKAKYFTADTEALINPLQPDSFTKEIPTLTPSQSQDIWQLLTNASYIITDQQRTDPATAIGKGGKSFLRDVDLQADLKKLNDNYTIYVEPIKRLIIATISQQRTLSLDGFKTTFLHWQNIDSTSSRLEYNWQQEIAKKIGQMLLDKGYLPTSTTITPLALDRNFTTILNHHSRFIPEIVKVLSQHFANSLGETAFDVESYDIDANGNHRHFYTGFNRYQLNYHNNSNQIQSVNLDWPATLEPQPVFTIAHDAQGNVIKALHKGIQHIEYHPVSQRTTRIQLTDGRTLRFYYNAQGERMLKQVVTAEGQISHETHYVRDEQGRVLVDRHVKYLTVPQQIVTAYLYGPRGLLGFIRNNTFYSVTTDHAGSIRLVIKAGQVVAAYDYLPYGQLMRSYGNDPQAHIIYRYTGQEWDEETGLYNYHARLYDPNIGRFYQLDPKAQYFSPYKYAGNSPVSLVDPDGELAFLPLLVIGGFALVGGYLGGAAANDDWNPIDWNWKDAKTYIGIGGGAIAGGFTPVVFPYSVAAIGVVPTIALAGGGAYLTTSTANQNWNPAKWEWGRPHTWNAIFQGASTGPGIVSGVSSVHKFASTFDTTRKATAFLTVSYLLGGGVAYYGGVKANEDKWGFWQWDWTNPATLSALVNGFEGGIGWAEGSVEIFRGVKNYRLVQPKHISPQAHYQLGSSLAKMSTSKKQVLKAILKDPNHPLYKVVASGVMAYFRGSSANEDFDFTCWNFMEFSTYEGVLNGIFSGKGTYDMLRSAVGAKTKKGAASNSRKKRSLNYVKSHKDQLTNTNRSKSSNIKHLTESLLFNTIPPINQSNVSYKEGSAKPNLNIQDNYCDSVSSGSSRLQFWPINLVKRVGVSMLSFLPTSRILMPSLKSQNYVPQPESFVKQQPPVTATETSPTFLETGDQWLKNTDMNGNLMWGILLVRKWTGYRPATTTKVLPHDLEISTTELNIWATTLVSEFMDTLLSHAQACGIRTVASSILEDFILHLKVIKSVHQKLSAGQLKAIPQLLCEQMVQQHINQIASASTQAQANKLLARITKDIPKLQQQLLQQQQEWLSRKQCLIGMTTSSPLNNTKRADINTLKQAISSVPHQGSKQLLQQQRGLGGN